MIIPDKGKTAAIILSKIHPHGTEQSQDMVPEDKVDDHIEVLTSISEKAIRAITDRNAHGLAQALTEFWDAIESADEKEDQEASDSGFD